MDRSSGQKTKKPALALSHVLDQLDFIYTYKFHPKAAEYIPVKRTWNIPGTEHTLGQKPGPEKLKKTEITTSILFNHDSLRLEINYRGKVAKNTTMRRLDNCATLAFIHGQQKTATCDASPCTWVKQEEQTFRTQTPVCNAYILHVYEFLNI